MIKKIVSIALLACLTTVYGCRKKEEAEPVSCDQLNARIQTLDATSKAYAANLTNKANCEAYRTALDRYLDAATNCPTASQTDIASARASLNATRCQ